MNESQTYYNKALNIENEEEYNELTLDLFHYQYSHNKVYRQFAELMKVDVASISDPLNIPFLPIEFFKSHPVVTGNFDPEITFESSGTTGAQTSKHPVKSIEHYKQCFTKAFELQYGAISNYCFLALLPSYLERKGSSLIAMADELISLSKHELSGFYLDEYYELVQVLQTLEATQQPTILLGVSFALLDFCEKHPMPLKNTIIMETGGMKGKREEMVRSELHERLKQGFQVSEIHSEYGMTELLSQAYSTGNGLFTCPPWMKVYTRDVDDPMTTHNTGRGALNIVDLANIDSCCFIATQDVGTIHENKTFEIQGRMDHSDVRGCNLLVVDL